jgi:hypothetical protein
MNKPLGDRRARVRFEVVGSFWGMADVSETARVVDINRTGALIWSRSAFATESTQVIRLTLEGQELLVDTKVRHLRRVPETEREPEHYLIGLEFLAVPTSLLETIDELAVRPASSS